VWGNILPAGRGGAGRGGTSSQFAAVGGGWEGILSVGGGGERGGRGILLTGSGRGGGGRHPPSWQRWTWQWGGGREASS